MKKHLSHVLILFFVVLSLSSCRTSAPRVDYRSLAKASVKLGVDINLEDNHKLYIESAEWIGVPYRSGGNTKRGVDCSGFTTQIYQKVYHIKLDRSTGGQMKNTKRVSKRNLREGDLVFFSSKRSRKKVAHVGIYLKDGKFIHASSSRGVIVSALEQQYYRKHWIKGGRAK